MNRRIDQYIAKYEELEELNSDKNDENDEFIKEIKALTIEFSSSFSFLEKILNAEIFISSLNQ
jgi:cell division septum initiation protein DivIVA